MASIQTRLTPGSIGSGGGNPRSVNITLSAGTTRKLIFVAWGDSAASLTPTIDSATFDGTAMTSFANRNTQNTRERWFYYDIPDGKADGTYAIAVTLSSNVGVMGRAAWLTQSDTVGVPVITQQDLGDGVTSATRSVTTVSGDVLIAVMMSDNSSNGSNIASSQVTFGTPVDNTDTGAKFRCEDAIADATETVTASYPFDLSAGTKSVTLIRSTPDPVGPTINTQPTAAMVRVNGDPTATATFTVAATGTGSITYDWELETSVGGGSYSNLADGSGATWTGQAAASCVGTFTAKTLSGRRVRCNVTDSNGTTTTDAVTLTVLDGPVLSASTATTNGSGVATVTMTSDDALTTNGEILLVTATVRGQVVARTVVRPA